MKTVLRIHGLDCADEAAELRSALQSRTGVSQLSFDVLRGLMFVEHEESHISRADLIVSVAQIGMRAEVWQADRTKNADDEETWHRSRVWLTMLSGVFLATAFVTHGTLAGWLAAFGADSSQTPGIVIALNLAAAVLGVSLVVSKAWSSLLRVRLDMNVLMLAAIAGAIGLGEFSEAATVAFLFALSLVLEAWSVNRARRAVEALMQLAPDTACVLRADGMEEIMSASEVPVGSTLVVRPGDKFPLDGRVTRGETSVNQAPITGESLPVVKRPGDDVFAGTINQDGAIEVLTTKVADDSTFARIVRLVADAQRKRSPAEAVGRSVCSVLHADGDGLGCGDHVAAAIAGWRKLGELVLSRLGVVGDLLSVRVGDLDAGQHGRGVGLGSSPRSAGEGGRLFGNRSGPASHRV